MAHLSGSPIPNQIVTASGKPPESRARSFGITKPLVRFGSPRKSTGLQLDGHSTAGLWNDQFIHAVGQIAIFFPLVENSMIDVLAELLGGDGVLARQVFASIINQSTRIKVMTSLLEQSSINKNKSEWYDAVIADFSHINRKRNEYVRGIWWTHESGRIFLALDTNDDYGWHEGEEVTLKHLLDVVERINDIMGRLRFHRKEAFEARTGKRASRDTSPQQPDAGSTEAPPPPRTTDTELPSQPQPSDPLPRLGKAKRPRKLSSAEKRALVAKPDVS